ncbi:MAG: transcriptional repressor LexA [Clostridia bacterium]|nr:transcriptional repressor LexA [Clostridia bacterium]MEE1054222.1 transcriptional repressor LexA [Acutalibacteraceae bacterium]
MSKPPLTEKQQDVYNFLVKQMSQGLPPTVREICSATGIKSTSTVHAILGALEDGGYIIRDPKNSRSIRVDMGAPSAMVPLVGRITAGKPILAIEEIEDYIPYPSKDAEGLFALKVVGLSMKDAGILDGDIIVANKNVPCRNGDIVVGMDGDSATVKRLVIKNGQIIFMPENPDFEPIFPENPTVLGKVVGSYRKY